MRYTVLVAVAMASIGSGAVLAQNAPAQNAPATTTVPPDKIVGPAPTAASNPALPSTNGAVNTAPQNTPGAPLAGANSFTEGEAASRISGRGFSQVTGLKLDDRGIWRGTAMKDGKSVQVALDYQGNVVAQ